MRVDMLRSPRRFIAGNTFLREEGGSGMRRIPAGHAATHMSRAVCAAAVSRVCIFRCKV